MLSGSDGGLFRFGRPTRSDTPHLSLSFREQRCVQIAHVAEFILLCVPKIRFYNIGDEVRRGQAVI